MVIFIPSHLEKTIPIVSQMSSMINKYTELYGDEDSLGSFDYYYSHYSIDPIKRFIELCLSKEDYPGESNELDNSYSEVVNYLVKKFYSVKGTSFVFDYMEKYLNFKFTGGYRYSVTGAEFTILSVKTTDLAVFIKTMEEFLSALLYFGNLSATIETATLTVEDSVNSYINVEVDRFKKFEATVLNLN